MLPWTSLDIDFLFGSWWSCVWQRVIIQKTATPLLLERSRIVIHWERVQCIYYVCCLWNWLGLVPNPHTSLPRHTSWDMFWNLLRSGLLDWKMGISLLLKPGTRVSLDFSCSITRPFGLYLQIHILDWPTSLQNFNLHLILTHHLVQPGIRQ